MTTTTIDETDEARVSNALATAAAATAIATQHIMSHQPFERLPEGLPERSLAEFRRIAETALVTRSESEALVAKDIGRYVKRLLSQNLQYPALGPARLAVLAHVAMAIGMAALARSTLLWQAVAASDWVSAADELLLTSWPVKAQSIEERRRVIELANMMRDGIAPARGA